MKKLYITPRAEVIDLTGQLCGIISTSAASQKTQDTAVGTSTRESMLDKDFK